MSWRFDATGSMRAPALLRRLLGPIVLLHLAPFFGTYYAESFYVPWFSWYPEAPRAVYTALPWTAAACAMLMTLGVRARAASVATFLLVGYNFFLSQTHFHHNRAFLLIVLGGVALLPTTRARGPLWPLWLLRFEHATTYFASGFSKLIDPDWWGGTVTWDRVLRYRGALDHSIAPEWLKELVTDERFHRVFAKANVLTELFLARRPVVPPDAPRRGLAGDRLPRDLEISARVQVFSFLAIATLLVWVTPETRDRTLFAPRGFARPVRALDWLARFRVEDAPGPVRVVDRGGRELTGGAAVRLVLSRLPLTFFPCAPLRALDVLRRRG